MESHPVVRNFPYCPAHVPDLVRYGSKPRREIARNPALEKKDRERPPFISASCPLPPSIRLLWAIYPRMSGPKGWTTKTCRRPTYCRTCVPRPQFSLPLHQSCLSQGRPERVSLV